MLYQQDYTKIQQLVERGELTPDLANRILTPATPMQGNGGTIEAETTAVFVALENAIERLTLDFQKACETVGRNNAAVHQVGQRFREFGSNIVGGWQPPQGKQSRQYGS